MSDGSGEKIKKFVFKTKNPRIGETAAESLEVVIPEVCYVLMAHTFFLHARRMLDVNKSSLNIKLHVLFL